MGQEILSNLVEVDLHTLVTGLFQREVGIEREMIFKESKIQYERNFLGDRVVIEQGAFSPIYSAYLNGKKIAVRESFLISDYDNLDEGMKKEAVDELKNISLSNHYNVKTFIGFVLTRHGKVLVLSEYLEGSTLQSFLENSTNSDVKYTQLQKLMLSLDIADSLRYLEDMRIVHRGLTLKNVIVDKNRGNSAKITEFGLQKVVNSNTNDLRSSHFKEWIAPEILSYNGGGKIPFNFQSDIYSFGAVLHSIFIGRISSPILMLPETSPSDCPEGIWKIISSCLQVDPTNRPKIEDCIKLIEKDLYKYSDVIKHLVNVVYDVREAQRFLRVIMANNMDEAKEICDFYRTNPFVTDPAIIKKEKYLSAIVSGVSESQALLLSGQCQCDSRELEYCQDFEIENNEEKAVEMFEKIHQSSKGILTREKVDEIYQLSKFFRRKKDYIRENRCLKISVDHKHSRSQVRLGYNYTRGRGGLKKDLVKSFQLYKSAADQKNSSGQSNVGRRYKHGIGTHQDFAKAIDYLQMAADQHELDAFSILGRMYEKGNGTEKNLRKAFRLYQRGAELGDKVFAQFNLANCYQNGWGCTKNIHMAIFLFENVSVQKIRKPAKKAKVELRRLKKFLSLTNVKKNVSFAEEFSKKLKIMRRQRSNLGWHN